MVTPLFYMGGRVVHVFSFLVLFCFCVCTKHVVRVVYGYIKCESIFVHVLALKNSQSEQCVDFKLSSYWTIVAYSKSEWRLDQII